MDRGVLESAVLTMKVLTSADHDGGQLLTGDRTQAQAALVETLTATRTVTKPHQAAHQRPSGVALADPTGKTRPISNEAAEEPGRTSSGDVREQSLILNARHPVLTAGGSGRIMTGRIEIEPRGAAREGHRSGVVALAARVRGEAGIEITRGQPLLSVVVDRGEEDLARIETVEVARPHLPLGAAGPIRTGSSRQRNVPHRLPVAADHRADQPAPTSPGRKHRAEEATDRPAIVPPGRDHPVQTGKVAEDKFSLRVQRFL